MSTERPIMEWEALTPKQKGFVKKGCEISFAFFLRVFFQLLQGQRFLWNWHHAVFCDIAEKIYRLEQLRTIVNCPPGSTKTEIWSIHWPAWCIMQCYRAGRSSRWLPISYSDDLVVENCGRVKELIGSEPFQAFWPLVLSSSTKSKSDWLFLNPENRTWHRMFGVSLMGQVTGRRAGYMIGDAFTGALVIDDPLPPRDEGGKRVNKSNNALNKVVRTRLAHDKVPIVMIQQRIGNGDSTDFLMSDKSPDEYTLHKVPAMLDRAYVDAQHENVRDMIARDAGYKGEKTSYWPTKEPTETLCRFENADAYTFSSQFQQDPDEALLEGMIYREETDSLVRDGRACHIPVEPSLPTHSFWDLGMNDDMAIWLVQPYRKELRLIAFYRNSGKGIEHYINWLLDFKDRFDIRYEKHFAPHDIAVRELMGDGKSREEIARSNYGISFTKVERPRLKRDGLQAVRLIFPRLWVDPDRCDNDPVTGAQVDGWKAIKLYHREYDPDKKVFGTNPEHDWCSNPADALQTLGIGWKDPVESKGDHADQFGGSNW